MQSPQRFPAAQFVDATKDFAAGEVPLYIRRTPSEETEFEATAHTVWQRMLCILEIQYSSITCNTMSPILEVRIDEDRNVSESVIDLGKGKSTQVAPLEDEQYHRLGRMTKSLTLHCNWEVEQEGQSQMDLSDFIRQLKHLV